MEQSVSADVHSNAFRTWSDMTRSGRILVVDDDVGVLTAARLLL
jgi:hypothetical protein